YSLSKLKNDTWQRFPSDPIWILVGHFTSPGEEFTQTIDILGLTSGIYRVSKEVSLGGFSGEHIEVSTEFTVDRPPGDPKGVPVYGYYPMVTGISWESLESPVYPMLRLYNRGGLELTLPSDFRIERNVGGEWIPFYNNTGEGSSKLLPGDTYKEVWQVKLEGAPI
ncbi:MAG: hypothetical protein NTY03_17625, partial [Candidatus Bathyarchaeota archaeon]|nr:hypothetical protein [Candidatus Bathyarchaeota archaeon]